MLLLPYSPVQDWQDFNDAYFDLHSAVPGLDFTIPTVFHFA